MKARTLFRWQRHDIWNKAEFWPNAPAQPSDCPCCDTLLLRNLNSIDVLNRQDDTFQCPLCGWELTYHRENQEWGVGDAIYRSVLLGLEADLTRKAVVELGKHLSNHFSDIYNLDWRKFEEVVADIFSEHGHHVILTSPTKDGGADLLLFHDSQTNLYGIVECKRYAASRTIGVDIVRKLVGAAVDWGVQCAYLVTTTNISSPAADIALRYKVRGYKVDLVAASDLLQLLRIYDPGIPRLEFLTEKARRDLIESNRSQLRKDGWK